MATTQPKPRGGRPAAPLPSFEQIVTQGVARQHLARLLGVPATKVDSWRRRGCPTTDGRFILRVVVSWLEEQAATPEAATSGEDSEAALARWRRARATREERLLAKDRGELVPREEVVDVVIGQIHALKARLRDATKKLAIRLYQGPSIVANEQELRLEFESMLRAFAAGMPCDTTTVTPSAEPDVPATGSERSAEPPPAEGETE